MQTIILMHIQTIELHSCGPGFANWLHALLWSPCYAGDNGDNDESNNTSNDDDDDEFEKQK